jgi:hypothetical protein
MVPLIRDLSLVGIFALWDRSEFEIWTYARTENYFGCARIIANQFSYRHIEKILAHSEQKFQTLTTRLAICTYD